MRKTLSAVILAILLTVSLTSTVLAGDKGYVELGSSSKASPTRTR